MDTDQSFLQKKLNSGIKLFNENKINQAEKCFKYLLGEKKTQLIAFFYLGIIEIKRNKTDNAKKYFFKILEIDDNHEMTNLNLGLVYFQEKDIDNSRKYFDKTLKINNQNLLAKYHLALIYLFNKEYSKAKKNFKEILLKEPKNINALNNLGICYSKQINFEKAIRIFNECLIIKKDHQQSILNLANCLFQIKNYDESINNYNKVLKLVKDHTIAKIGLSKCYFALHNYEKGFYFYEARKKRQLDKLNIINHLIQNFNCKEWFEEKLDGKTILILSEQGIGDNLQFARYIYWLKEKFNCNIIFYINKKISHLFKDFPCKVMDNLAEVDKIDFYQYLLTLPYIHYKIENKFQKCIPYIPIDKSNNLNWKKKLEKLRKPIIAIQWKGNERFIDDQQRSIPIKYFSDLIKNNNYSFISLQKDNFSTEIKLNNLQDYVTDFSEQIDLGDKSFFDTISILNNIDLLISVDTSMTHLASTMQTKTLLLLNSNPDWRWHIELKEKCFYDNLEIIKTDEINDWETISLKINDKLIELFKN